MKLFVFLLVFLSFSVRAELLALSDGSLADVSGQAGITVDIKAGTTVGDGIDLSFDPDDAGDGLIHVENLQFLNADRTETTALRVGVDVGNVSGDGVIALTVAVEPGSTIVMDSIKLAADGDSSTLDSAPSLGAFVFSDISGEAKLNIRVR